MPIENDPAAWQSRHPSPGAQLTGGNRQIRTAVPPLARGGTPVIACAGGAGVLLGCFQRRDVPDLQRFVTAAADDPLPVGAVTHAMNSS